MREKPQKVLYYRTEAVLNGKVPQTMNSRHMNYTYDRGKRLENSKLKDGGNYTCDRERNQEELMCSELAMKYPNQVLSAPRCTGQQLSKLWNREDHIEIRFHKEGADEMKTMEKSDRKMVDAISIKLEDKLPIISNLLKDNVGDINKKGRKEFRDKENKSRKEKMMADQKEAPALPVNTEKLILPLKTENHKKAHKLPVRTQNRKKSTEIEQREKCDAVKGDKDLWDIMNLEKQKKIRDNKNKETSVKEIIRREEEAVENEDFSEKRDLDKQNQSCCDDGKDTEPVRLLSQNPNILQKPSGIEHHGDFGDLVGQHNMDGFISLQSMQSSNISDFQIQKNERIEVTLTSDQDNRIQVPETLGSHDEESEKEKLCKDEKEEECVLDGHEKRDDKEVFQDMTIWTRKLQDNIHKAGEEYEKLQNFFKRISQLYRKFECCKTSLPEIFLKGFNVDGFKNRRIPGRHTMSKQEKDVNRKWRKNDMHHHDNNVEYKDRLTMLGRELHTYLQEKEHYVRYWNPVHGLSGYGNSRHWNPCHGLSRSHSNGDISRHIPGESKGESNQSPCDSDNSEGYRGRKKWSDGMSEKENRNYEDEKDRDEQEDPPYNDEIVSRTKTGHGKQLFREEATQPNYKYRKKHGQLEGGDFQLSDNLGLLLTIDKDIPPDLRKFIIDINPCLITCLKRHTSDSDLDPCSICLCLISLIQHFGSCPSDLSPMTNFCCLCVQLFRLVQQHVLICMENTGEMDCPLLMCRKISFLIEKDSRMIHTKEQKIWKKLKKYMSGFTGNKRSMETEKFDEEFFSLSSLTSINPLLIPSVGMSNPNTQTKSHRPSTTYMPSLQIIPEDSSDRSLNIQRDVPLTPERGSRSEPIVRKAEDGTVQVISKIIRSPRTRMTRPDRLIVSQFGTVSSLIGHPDTPTVTGPPTISPKTPKKVSFSESPHRAKSDIVADAFPETLQQEEADTDLQLSSIPSEPTSFEKVYGERLKSLPVEGHRRPIQDQILSLKEKPTGIPGIGEVVYGIREVLLEVVKYWGDLKMEYKEFGRLIQNSVKEEGVIFPDCKKKLMIMRHRYQKNFQWVRLTHLGSGMFGNCHLASDHNSDYHFCIKKIHISKYNEDEIKIWSSLDNPNIVKFHGALRRKEKIYIISEFIEGGNLTEAVNQQKRLMRRLGQKTALHIFRQLLHVLLYLEKKSVVHEDIKADNILLRGKSLEIAVADFGTARRMTGKQSSLVGTPTHFSPEKAESSGHGFKSDLWAAVCVLVHMLSGDPPWVKRFSNATTLHFIIATKPPPLEDVPNNIREDVRNLIRDGFSKKPQERPSSKELLQHRAFNLIHDYGGETQYSILPTNLADDDTRLPSHKTNLQTLQILSEVQEDLENPPNERSPGIETLFEGKLDIRDVNITGMLGKSKPEQKSQDLTLQSLPEKTTRFSSLEDSPIYSSIKKSILASPEEIINSVKDPEEYIKSYYSDRFQPGEFFHPENLVITALPVYIQEHGDQYTPNQPIQNEELVPESTNNHSGDLGVLPNLPFFASEGPDNAHDNDSESEFDRLQARALREQLSKTSTTSTGSDGGRISSVLNSSGEEFFQDRIIETLIEEPESSALDDDDDDRLQNTDNHQSFSSEEVFNERDIEIQDKMRSESVTPTGPGNLPNIILDFTSSTSTISNSKSAKSIDIIVTIQTDEEQNDTGDCRTAKVEEEKTIVVQNPIPDLQEINQSLQKKSSSDTMFDYVDRDISEDDLFGDDALKKNSKDHGSFSSSGLESLSQELQPAIANEPLRPFVVKRDPKDPTKAEVVPETDPDKFIEHPITFKKKSPKNLNLNLKREKRKSTPEFPITTPVTPSKYYTPQLNQPLGHLHTPTSGYNTSTPSFNNRPSFPDLRSNRSSSPRQTSSLLDRSEEEIEKYYRELSQHSGDPLSDLDQQDQPEVEFHIENDNDYDQSLSYCLEKYVQSTPNDDKNVKVTIKKLDGESLTAKLTFEYSKGIWKDFVEEWASQIQTNDCKIFTLHNSDGKQIDLQERPLDLHKDYNVTLHMVDASKDFFNQAWYCENGICKMGPGIPVLV